MRGAIPEEYQDEIRSASLARGNYLVVASNVAWLRSDENGQTKVGMVGGAAAAGDRLDRGGRRNDPAGSRQRLTHRERAGGLLLRPFFLGPGVAG